MWRLRSVERLFSVERLLRSLAVRGEQRGLHGGAEAIAPLQLHSVRKRLRR